eukprot:1664238-Heterocapsa_arctica.AAC.1
MNNKEEATLVEGGERGAEMALAADMGGFQFFCIPVEEPEGDCALPAKSLDAMNERPDPTDEEPKGGSGHVGKIIFSAGDEYIAIAAY